MNTYNVGSYLFWFDSVNDPTHIIRSDLKGETRVALAVTSPANRMTIDVRVQRVYHLDISKGQVGYINYGTSTSSIDFLLLTRSPVGAGWSSITLSPVGLS